MLASAHAVTIPPLVVAARKPGGTAPLQRSFVRIDRRDGDAVLSALKTADDRDSLIVRLFNPDDRDAEIAIAAGSAVRQAWAVDFLEQRRAELTVGADGVHIRLGPHQIKTIELCLTDT
jgi:alpha-mannosidase